MGSTGLQRPGPRIFKPATWGRHHRTELENAELRFREQGEFMLKARRDAAMKVAKSLFAAEEALDVALARAAELNSVIVSARAEAKLSALLGQDAIESAASTFAALVRARCEIVETHKRLDEAKTQIGLRTVSIGDVGPKPPAPTGFNGLSHLAAVA